MHLHLIFKKWVRSMANQWIVKKWEQAFVLGIQLRSQQNKRIAHNGIVLFCLLLLILIPLVHLILIARTAPFSRLCFLYATDFCYNHHLFLFGNCCVACAYRVKSKHSICIKAKNYIYKIYISNIIIASQRRTGSQSRAWRARVLCFIVRQTFNSL